MRNKEEISQNICSKAFLEAFLFVLWELDVSLFSSKQTRQVREKCLSSYIYEIVKTCEMSLDIDEIKDVLFKRMDEYGSLERNKQNKIGSPTDLVTNFFIYNLDYALEQNRFYMCEGSTRPLYLMGITEAMSYGMFVLKYHARISGFLLNLFKETNDFTTISKKDFEQRFSVAHDKDVSFQKELNKKGFDYL